MYLVSISLTAHFRATTAFLGSVTTGVSKWGMPSYTDSSNILGSIIIILQVSGVCLYSHDNIIAFMPTDFPEPVVPATNKCGIFAKSTTIGNPAIFLPKHTGKLNDELINSSCCKIFLSITVSLTLF